MFIEVRNLNIDLGGEFQLKDVNFSIEKGDYVVMIGPTGSGKSVIIEALAGFYTPDRGSIVMDSVDITKTPPEKRNMSLVYQDYMLFPHMNVYENIAYGLKNRVSGKDAIREKILSVAHLLGVEHILHRFPSTLSGGEAQRVAIARALVVEPSVLLMDEPFSALDVKTKEELRKLVKAAVSGYGTTVIHVTHDLEDVWSLASHVIVIRDGRVMQIGSPEDIFSNPVEDFVADFVEVNTFRGMVLGYEDGMTVVDVKGFMRLYSVDRGVVGRCVTVTIRPERIVFLKGSECDGDIRNVFRAKVKDMNVRGGIVKLMLDVNGLIFRVMLTVNVCDMLDLDCDSEVTVGVGAEYVRISPEGLTFRVE